ncbi:hypothetical protein PBI_PAEDORE_83 [Streptomyces phage Paedore]|uniref:Uncharacterized protein n=1 Tax=Streptomyces phage Paedore TaxID=2108134 RepID=A0A2P1JTU0_9CAUD|nr:hypothetical protein KGG91_gp83 [Streptomyces phage Paedore]AVO22566.1 hypothetical protein PBI_PAEDORE_83 [Streptomyces phage Paedore]
MICGLCSDAATHYYVTASRGNAYQCQYHADRFGYPQYLVEINPPRPPLLMPGYVVQTLNGSGEVNDAFEAWPFDEDFVEPWISIQSGADERSIEWLVGDAAYYAYEPQYLEATDVNVEVTRVTCLALVQV